MHECDSCFLFKQNQKPRNTENTQNRRIYLIRRKRERECTMHTAHCLAYHQNFRTIPTGYEQLLWTLLRQYLCWLLISSAQTEQQAAAGWLCHRILRYYGEKHTHSTDTIHTYIHGDAHGHKRNRTKLNGASVHTSAKKDTGEWHTDTYRHNTNQPHLHTWDMWKTGCGCVAYAFGRRTPVNAQRTICMLVEPPTGHDTTYIYWDESNNSATHLHKCGSRIKQAECRCVRANVDGMAFAYCPAQCARRLHAFWMCIDIEREKDIEKTRERTHI